MNDVVTVVGGGLAGCEAALQLLSRGFGVKMYEMRPVRMTGAHSTDALAELVCSNSLKSEGGDTASGTFKEELDALAWELNILWYDVGANIDTKRDVIKNSDLVYRRLGTKWAVESVIKSYFGDGYITEWFEYGGQPGRFRVYTANPSVSEERYGEFLNLLEKIKRASAKFDGLYITLTGQMPLYAGMAVHQSGRERYEIGATL